MFTTAEKEQLSRFFSIEKSTDDILLYLSSKETDNQWLLIDFSEKFEERYGIYLKKNENSTYVNFNQVKALTNVLNLISSYEMKRG